ncbi:hypothetical protein NA57DRAFT_70962 [Rhizodiscina lignyota]|uniref:DUF7704 domain-containing protein n=1 Tax=Rhizodiscina lignyota TaxID=1504668 RepID=A0A9P4MBU6_9PEZI|nr:hypothetical protein NA57DRAFT_70962 [Rhizodiscina lignyota]
MASQLPTVPRVTFTILEPISLFAGWIAPLMSPEYFVSNQLPSSALPHPSLAEPSAYPLRPHETILAMQVSNCYLLLGLLGIFILNTTTELKVVRAYLWALWLGDIGHVGVTMWCMGWEAVRDVGNWNAVVWGNIAATVVLFSIRTAYFAGLFGERNPRSARAARGGSASRGRGKGRGKGKTN